MTVQKRETQDYKAYPVSDSTVFLNWVSKTTAKLCKTLNIRRFYSIIL